MFTYKMLRLLCFSKRMFSTSGNMTLLEHLNERSLIRVAGEDATAFLQGLITNDIYHLAQRSGGSMYTMFLNTKGRVLYDTIIYKTKEDNTYYVECDKTAMEPLQKHLKIYRVKRKVDVSDLHKQFRVYSLFKVSSDGNSELNKIGVTVPSKELKLILPQILGNTNIYNELIIFRDPRVIQLGFRIISKVDTDVKNKICEIMGNVDAPNENINYKISRYSLGVGEGFNDLPVANCFPLECNCDYLNGISFHKGCYIGQELTARTHHTGIVRKRLMPLNFIKVPTKLPTDNVILHKNVNLGRLRGIEGNVGLALLRMEKALDFAEFSVGNGLAKVTKPNWWPLEVHKEKLNIGKN